MRRTWPAEISTPVPTAPTNPPTVSVVSTRSVAAPTDRPSEPALLRFTVAASLMTLPLAISSVPRVMVTPPEKLLAPVRRQVPAPSLVRPTTAPPEPLEMAPLMVLVPVLVPSSSQVRLPVAPEVRVPLMTMTFWPLLTSWPPPGLLVLS